MPTDTRTDAEYAAAEARATAYLDAQQQLTTQLAELTQFADTLLDDISPDHVTPAHLARTDAVRACLRCAILIAETPIPEAPR